ncbi:hypothetical protein DdX_10218 [Ditylenchus destructor]|uniref:Uncharacterized protein n=1 Tax=Ditylenchus destructor TaxID=166010 RepID=A0AAD4N4S5_9BILA|nr:hypothetical protein DdX_10218 [Ditylenchus destructor]
MPKQTFGLLDFAAPLIVAVIFAAVLGFVSIFLYYFAINEEKEALKRTPSRRSQAYQLPGVGLNNSSKSNSHSHLAGTNNKSCP